MAAFHSSQKEIRRTLNQGCHHSGFLSVWQFSHPITHVKTRSRIKKKKKDKKKTGFMTLETRRLQNLLEGTVDGRPDGDTLVEVNGGKSALADALRSELEFLRRKKSVHENIQRCYPD